MGLLIGALLVASVGAIVAFAVMLAVRSKQEFATQNEVVPGRQSPAPASWAGAHSREAKLHRRLGAAVDGAHENPRFVELGLGAQMTAIEAEALAIDERLVAAAALPTAHRDGAIDTLEEHVVALEAAIGDLATSVSVADSKVQLEAAVSEADVTLRALAEARAEVEQIDRRASGTETPDLNDAAPVRNESEAFPPSEPGATSG